MNVNPGWLFHSVFLILLVSRTKTSSVNYFPCPYEHRFNSCKIEDLIIHPCDRGLFDSYCNLYPIKSTVMAVIWTSPMRCKTATWNLYVHLSNGYQSIVNDTDACHYTKCPFDGERRMLIYEFRIPAHFRSQIYEFMVVLRGRKGIHACCTCFKANVINEDINLPFLSKTNSTVRNGENEFWANLAVLSTSQLEIYNYSNDENSTFCLDSSAKSVTMTIK